MKTDNLKLGVLINTFYTLLFVNTVGDSIPIRVYICHNQYSRTYSGQLDKKGSLTTLKINIKNQEELWVKLKEQMIHKEMQDILETIFNTKNN